MKLIKAGAGAVIIALDNELTISSEQELMEIVDSLQHDSVNNILLDFDQVNLMDNTGLNVLVKLSVRARKSRQSLLAIGVSKGYLDIFSITGLDRTYRVYASLSDVLMAAGPSTEPEVRSILDRPGRTEECALPGSECWAPLSKNWPCQRCHRKP